MTAAALSLVPPPPDAPRPRRLVAVRTIELPLRPPPPPGQLCLFADEPPVVLAKRQAPPPPAPLPSGEVQVALPLGRGLPLIDVHRVTRGRCLVQHDGCPATTCRHRLDAVATFRGRRFGCSLAVAHAYPHGLPPQHVARLLGMDEEGEVQRVEHVGLEHLRAESRDAFDDWRE